MVEIAKFINLGGKQKSLPMHIALSCSSIKQWCDENKKDPVDAIKKNFELFDGLIDYQLKNELRVLSILVSDTSSEYLDSLNNYLKNLIETDRINKSQVRIFVIGQWYDLNVDLSDTLKSLMDRTKLYDKYFLNICINYDGQEEILGAVRLLTRNILAGKLIESDLREETVKGNLYSSYFPPPQLIIETQQSYSGLLLWDSKGAVIFHSEKRWPAFDLNDFEKAINFYDALIKKE